MVLKPAKKAPFSALALAELSGRAGVPKGVFRVMTGDSGAIRSELTSNAPVWKLSFTASTEVGRKLIQQCAPTVKKMSLELGGNVPFIVFNDEDLDAAVEGAMISKFRNAGQTCVFANRIYVQDHVYDASSAKLTAKVNALKVGNGVEAGITTGPLIDKAAVAKVEVHVADALAEGGKIATGGKSLGGQLFAPTLTPRSMRK